MPKLRTRLFQTWFRLSRPMTMGVRGLVENARGEVLFVHHTYTRGWYLPGGGLEHGETVREALGRELAEEGGIDLIAEPRLIGVYSNHHIFRNDHVVFYHVAADAWQACDTDNAGEISDICWRPPSDPPDGATPGTLRRLEELFKGAAQSAYW